MSRVLTPDAPAALLDLDFTLIPMDSGTGWVRWLAFELGRDAAPWTRALEGFTRDYEAGTLDILAWMRFHLSLVEGFEEKQVQAWAQAYAEHWVRPAVPKAVRELLAQLRAEGVRLVMATATLNFVTAPIARMLGIPELIAARAEAGADGRFTGRLAGDPTLGPWKLRAVRRFFEEQGGTPCGLRFFSDSHNDLPLFSWIEEQGGTCIAANPDAALRRQAAQRGWRVFAAFGPEEVRAAREPSAWVHAPAA